MDKVQLDQVKHDRWEQVNLPRLYELFPRIIQRDLKTIPPPAELETATIESSYIHGEIGTGKTVLAAFMLLQEAKNNFYNHHSAMRYYFISVPELLLKFKNTYNSNSSETESGIMDVYSRADLLVLDDFGVEKTTDWSFQLLYMLINRRYEDMRKTIITANISLQQLGEKLGDFRIPSRIQSMCKIIKLTGQDYRAGL